MNFGNISRIIVLGGGNLLVKLCLTIAKKKLDIVIVTSERHAEERIKFYEEEMELTEFLDSQNIKFIISENVNTDNNVREYITNETLGISTGAAWILKENFIKLFNGKLLNMHGSRLPQDRGGGGFSWRIMRNDRTGISLFHQIDPGIDTGNIVDLEYYNFPDTCITSADYEKYYIDKNIEFFENFFSKIVNGEDFFTYGQPEYLSSYWPRLSTDIHGAIDWNWELKSLVQFTRAFDEPYKGAFTYLNDKKVRLRKCSEFMGDGVFHPFQNGIIYKKISDTIFVATVQGTLISKEVLNDDGENLLSTINIGDRFYTPIDVLEKAKHSRVIYTPKGIKTIESKKI